MDADDEYERAQVAKRGTPFLNSDQAAAWLGLSLRTLQNLRGSGDGPVFRFHSRRVQYHIDDLVSWSQDHARREVGRG
jgi:hypothetical protein